LVTIARADRSEPRYRFLEPVREVALSLAERAGETAALRARHRDAYLASAERLAPSLTSGSAQARALAWLEAEHENLQAALALDVPGDDSARCGGSGTCAATSRAAARHWHACSRVRVPNHPRRRVRWRCSPRAGSRPSRATSRQAAG
jgi:predicted ATPase